MLPYVRRPLTASELGSIALIEGLAVIHAISRIELVEDGLRSVAHSLWPVVSAASVPQERVLFDLSVAAYRMGLPGGQKRGEAIVVECWLAAAANEPPPASKRAIRLANLRPWGPDNPPPKSPGRPRKSKIAA